MSHVYHVTVYLISNIWLDCSMSLIHCHIPAFLCLHFTSTPASWIHQPFSDLLPFPGEHSRGGQYQGLSGAREIHLGEWEEGGPQPDGLLPKCQFQQVRYLCGLRDGAKECSLQVACHSTGVYWESRNLLHSSVCCHSDWLSESA